MHAKHRVIQERNEYNNMLLAAPISSTPVIELEGTYPRAEPFAS